MKVTGNLSRRTLQRSAPVRKRFRGALGLAGLTQGDFAQRCGVTSGHLSQVLSGDRDSASLMQKIEAFIAQHLVQKAS